MVANGWPVWPVRDGRTLFPSAVTGRLSEDTKDFLKT